MKKNDHPEELDALDRRILRILQQRGDISHAELAQEVAASQASCWRRIKAIHKASSTSRLSRTPLMAQPTIRLE